MSSDKWKCSHCTYLNWNASLKCVICSHEKLESDELNQEIYQLNISQERINDPFVSSQYINDNTKTKWSCDACTYLNWPKAKKCVQCNTVKPTKQSLLNEETVSRDNSSNDETTKTSNNVRDTDSYSLSKALKKWNCSVCTYENWPKSQNCTMCQNAFNSNESSKLNKIDCESATSSNKLINPSSKLKDHSDRQSIDVLWLEACNSLLNGNLYSFESYLLAVDCQLDRTLTVQECRVLNQPEIFQPGLTLLDMACKLHRNDFIELYLSSSNQHPAASLITPTNAQQPSTTTITGGNNQQPSDPNNHNNNHLLINSLASTTQSGIIHRMPCHISPHKAIAIQSHLLETLRQRKGDFPCYIVQEHSTFWLPWELELLPLLVRCKLFEELIDKHVQTELEINEKVINFWCHSSSHNNRLVALWNRTAGDCLLDSVLQATWGILDRDNILRQALSESMRGCQHIFYPRWRQYEAIQARAYHYTINELQYQRDWSNLLQSACQQGEPLEQIHIFILCHILRRPIIVYGVKFINNQRNEPVGLSHFHGVYLPLLWERSFCSRNPIVLGYTRGHFSALIPTEIMPNNHPANIGSAAIGALGGGSGGNVQFNVSSGNLTGAAAATSCPISLHSTYSSQVRGQSASPIQASGSSAGASNDLGLVTLANNNTTANNNQLLNPHHYSCVCLLPLYNCSKQLLPVHFLSDDEARRPDSLLRDWMDVVVTRRGYLMARMRSSLYRHPLVGDLISDWLEEYRYFAASVEEDDEEDEDDDDDELEEEDDEEEDDEDPGSSSTKNQIDTSNEGDDANSGSRNRLSSDYSH